MVSQPLVRAALRALYVGGAAAATLCAWGVAVVGIAMGADSSAHEQTNRWTPLVVGPIIVVYEPEETWLTLFWLAPAFAAVVVFVAELRTRVRRRPDPFADRA